MSEVLSSDSAHMLLLLFGQLTDIILTEVVLSYFSGTAVVGTGLFVQSWNKIPHLRIVPLLIPHC